MIKYCLEKWNKNSERLFEKIRSSGNAYQSWTYTDLVIMISECIFEKEYFGVTTIAYPDNRRHRLFLIAEHTYQPSETGYLMTYVDYGSCSGCDTFESIKADYINSWDDPISEKQANNIFTLCRDIVNHTIKPYNHGWRNDPRFDHVEGGE